MADAKILMVTADAELASSCCEALPPRFDDVVRVDDGEAALLAAVRADFAVFVIDLELPQTDPLHVVSALRGYGPTRHAAVIAIAETRSDDLVELVTRRGCDRVIERPIDPAAMARQLDDLLSRRVARAA